MNRGGGLGTGPGRLAGKTYLHGAQSRALVMELGEGEPLCLLVHLTKPSLQDDFLGSLVAGRQELQAKLIGSGIRNRLDQNAGTLDQLEPLLVAGAGQENRVEAGELLRRIDPVARVVAGELVLKVTCKQSITSHSPQPWTNGIVRRGRRGEQRTHGQ